MTRTRQPSHAFALVATLLGGGFALAGCETSPYSAGRTRTTAERSAGLPIDYDEYGRLGYVLAWKGYPSVTGSLPINYILPFDDIVVTLEGGSKVAVLDAVGSTQRCANQLANPLTRFAGLARSGDRILVVGEAELFAMDSKTCTVTSRSPFEKIVGTQPALAGDVLIVGSHSGELMGVRTSGPATGTKAWGIGGNGAFRRTPVLIGSAVGAVSSTGDILFADAASGSLLGRSSIFRGADADPVTDGRLMFVASLDQSIYAFSPLGASQVWRHRTERPLRAQPTVHDGVLYAAIPGMGLRAFDAATGTVRWTCKAFEGTVVAVNRGRLLAFDGKDAALIDPARGDVLERSTLKGVSMLRPDRFVDGNLYAVSTTGVVAKFNPRR
ncbi:MAG: PQQ-binding-like beta-propeller repeat protein [Phycisphaerae bacterium]|nr:PQQ-binding-like beta-propeller repeat protein [Phycisphaerae bacterium]